MSEPRPGASPIIGRRLPRKEDRRLLTGQGRYLDDLDIPGAAHVSFVRSPHAHARIRSIDVAAASGMPGVIAIVTGRVLASWTTPLRIAPPIDGLRPVETAALPLDKVRFQGDPVACVVASDRYRAEDAAERIAVDFEPLAAVVDMFKATEPDAPLVDDAVPSNLVFARAFSIGRVEARFAEADAVVKATFSQHRQTHAPIETRGAAAIWDEGRRHLTFYMGNQVPHPARTILASRLGLDEHQVTFISPDIGGSFGQKIALYREELAVAALARALKTPVRWREDRLENLLASAQAREDFVRVEAAVTRTGRLLALKAEIIQDWGAYCFYPASYTAQTLAAILPGPYRLADYACDIRVVLTNKCGLAPMRAPPAIASWVADGTMEAIARQLGLDPVAVRRINLLDRADLPYVSATGIRIEDVTPGETLDESLKLFDHDSFRASQAEDRRRGRHRGLGICVALEPTTFGSEFYRDAGIPGSGYESAWVKIEPSGAVAASVGMMDAGQGYETTFAQVVADGLGVDPDRVAIVLGNTDVAPYGMGSRGSRGGTAGGGALHRAAGEMRGKVLAIAAKLLGLNSSVELRLERGAVERLISGAWTATGLDLAAIARIAYLDPLKLPGGLSAGLEVRATYEPPPLTWSNATHLCEVEVDVATGTVTILRYLIVEDCGTVLNPMVVEGQLRGATAMGIGGALFEQVVYDGDGQNLTGSLADYLMPTAAEIPRFEIHHRNTPSRRTPLGTKGMAEGGVMGAIGALCNAVGDALAPFGIVIDRQPLSPDRLRSMLRAKGVATDAAARG